MGLPDVDMYNPKDRPRYPRYLVGTWPAVVNDPLGGTGSGNVRASFRLYFLTVHASFLHSSSLGTVSCTGTIMSHSRYTLPFLFHSMLALVQSPSHDDPILLSTLSFAKIDEAFSCQRQHDRLNKVTRSLLSFRLPWAVPILSRKNHPYVASSYTFV